MKSKINFKNKNEMKLFKDKQIEELSYWETQKVIKEADRELSRSWKYICLFLIAIFASGYLLVYIGSWLLNLFGII